MGFRPISNILIAQETRHQRVVRSSIKRKGRATTRKTGKIFQGKQMGENLGEGSLQSLFVVEQREKHLPGHQKPLELQKSVKRNLPLYRTRQSPNQSSEDNSRTWRGHQKGKSRDHRRKGLFEPDKDGWRIASER